MSLYSQQQSFHQWQQRRAVYEDANEADLPPHDQYDSHYVLVQGSSTQCQDPHDQLPPVPSSSDEREFQGETQQSDAQNLPPSPPPTSDAEHQPPEYQPPPPAGPSPPTYNDADTQIMSVAIPESQLAPPEPSTTPKSGSSRGVMRVLSKLKPNPTGAVRIVVMTKGDYHRYWARDKKGKYIGSEPETEGPRIWREKMLARSQSVAGPSSPPSARGGVISPSSVPQSDPANAGTSDLAEEENSQSPSDRKSEAVEAMFSQLDQSAAHRVSGPSTSSGEGSRRKSFLKKGLNGPRGAFQNHVPGYNSVYGMPHPTG